MLAGGLVGRAHFFAGGRDEVLKAQIEGDAAVALVVRERSPEGSAALAQRFFGGCLNRLRFCRAEFVGTLPRTHEIGG